MAGPPPPAQVAPPPPDRRSTITTVTVAATGFYRDRDDYTAAVIGAPAVPRASGGIWSYVSRYSFRGDDRYRLDRTYRELTTCSATMLPAAGIAARWAT